MEELDPGACEHRAALVVLEERLEARGLVAEPVQPNQREERFVGAEKHRFVTLVAAGVHQTLHALSSIINKR